MKPFSEWFANDFDALKNPKRGCVVPGKITMDWLEEAYLAGAAEARKEAARECMEIAGNEPEYPGNMPDEMWEAIEGNRDATAEALRITVRLTKEGIAAAIRKQFKL